MENLEQYIEALIFSSELSLGTAEIKMIVDQTFQSEIAEDEIRAAIGRIREKYDDDSFAIGLAELNGGYQFLTKKAYYRIIQSLQIFKARKKLSQAAIETLAIIAYRQPITKSAIEAVRGVACDGMLQKLLDRELVRIGGRAELPGRPLLYETTESFYEHFGIRSIDDLPNATELRRVKLPEAPAESAAAVESQLALSATEAKAKADAEAEAENAE